LFCGDSSDEHLSRLEKIEPTFLSHTVTHMNQTLLFPDLLADRRTAIEADVDAAGGQQVVGHELGLADDPVTAGKLLSNKINQNGRHRLSDEETWRIRQLARQKAGRSRLHDLECASLKFEGKWLTTEDIRARKRKRKSALLEELLKLEREDEE
jgi:hypothetical protein